MKFNRRMLLVFGLVICISVSGCGQKLTPVPTDTFTPAFTNTPLPPTITPVPPTATFTSTSAPLPTEVTVLVSPEAMKVVSSWNSSINAFTPANNPVTTLNGLTANDIGFWNNSRLDLYQDVVKLISADFGSPYKDGLFGEPEVNDAFPSLRIYFTDDSVTEIDGAARVKFQQDSSTSTNSSTSTGSIAPGDWVATTDFGKLVFTVDASGSKITKMSYQFSEWTCGPTTNSGTIEVSSQWPISDGKFSVNTTFDPDNQQKMTFGGTYDATSQKFSGTFDEVSYGTPCSGTWEAVAPK